MITATDARRIQTESRYKVTKASPYWNPGDFIDITSNDIIGAAKEGRKFITMPIPDHFTERDMEDVIKVVNGSGYCTIYHRRTKTEGRSLHISW